MRKITLISLMLVCSIISFAQPQNYVFTVTNGVPYQNLVSPSVITTTDWDDFAGNVPLGFKFHFLGDSTDTFYFDDADMNVGTDMQFSKTALGATTFNLVTMLIDLQDRHINDPSQNSTVGYKTDIVGGKKITKIEWRNAAIFDDTTMTDTMNAQCWVYEADDAIEFRIGNSSRKDITGIMNDPNIYGFKGPFFGFFKSVNPMTFSSDWIYYVSNTTTPKVDSIDFASLASNPSLVGVDSFPKENTLLRWSKAAPNGINSVKLNDNIAVYPTICTSELHINFNNDSNYQLALVSNNGSIVMSKKLTQKNEKIDMSNLANGNYFIVLTNENQKIVYQITKQ